MEAFIRAQKKLEFKVVTILPIKEPKQVTQIV